MHYIMSSELRNSIELLSENQNELKTIFFDWSSILNDNDKNFCDKLNERFSRFFNDLSEHLKKTRYIISNIEIDNSKESFIDFLKDYYAKSDELYNIHKDYDEKLKILHSEFQNESDISDDSDPILQLINARDQLYMNKFLCCYHQTLYNFFKGEHLISIYINNIKDNFKI